MSWNIISLAYTSIIHVAPVCRGENRVAVKVSKGESVLGRFNWYNNE